MLALLFAFDCYSQAKNEIGISYGYHSSISGSYQRSLYGIVYEDATGVKNGRATYDPNFLLKVNYYRVFNDYIKAGNGVVYNSIDGCQNISPFLSGKVNLPLEAVHPYIVASIGINFMKFDSNRFYPGIFCEMGTGLNIDVAKTMYVDLGINYGYFDSRESKKEGKITSNSVIQRFKSISLMVGLMYRIR